MENNINFLKGISLSDKQLEQMTGCKVLLYEELYKYETLEFLLDANNGKVILLYISKDDPDYGHWCCILKTNYGKDKKECVEWSDSYGLKPDEEMKFSSAVHGQQFNYLSLLMLDSPYVLTYNNHKFQQEKNNINTCGWHCACRLLNNNKSLDGYKKYLDAVIKESPEIKNYDDAVCVLMYDSYKKAKSTVGGKYFFKY